MTLHWLIPLSCTAILLSILAIRGSDRLGLRWSSVILVTAFIPLAYMALNDLLSRPKPMSLEWANTNDITVISSRLVEDEAIYLWLDMDTPRSYVLPWSDDVARELHEAEREAGVGNGILKFNGNGGETVFHVEPVPELPQKAVE